MNCLHMRKYFKQLFAPNEPIMTESEDSDDEEAPEAVEIRSGDIWLGPTFFKLHIKQKQFRIFI